MKNSSKLFLIIGCLLLVLAVVSKYMFPVMHHALSMKAISFVTLANTSFLLAILFKKQ